MARLSCTIRQLWQSAGILYTCMSDAVWFLQLCLHSTAALAAENLFLRKQLARYQGHHVIPRCPTNATRFTLVWLSQGFDWRPALAVVQPETFQRWRRQRCKQFWRCTSGPGRPPIPGELQALIRQMARDNLTWGQRRIANELQLQLGLRVSPRTVHTYIPRHLPPGPGQRTTSQRWRTFVRTRAWDLIARAVASDLTRGMQAFAAWMRWLCQRWRRPIVASTLRGTPLHDATCLARPSAPASGLCGRQSPWRRSGWTNGVRPIAGHHAPMILVSPLEPHWSIGSTCVLLVLLCIGGTGPPPTRRAPGR
jgi:hypothetical protein